MSRHLSFLLLASLIVLELDMITSIMIPSVSCLYGRCLMVSPSSLRWAQFGEGSMIKRANRIQEIKREQLPWTRLKRGPDEEVIAETKRDAGEWTRLKKETGARNDNDDGARTKKGRERAVISFFDWARLKRGLGSWMKRGSEVEEDGGWIRMM